jgi:hypothetical protein
MKTFHLVCLMAFACTSAFLMSHALTFFAGVWVSGAVSLPMGYAIGRLVYLAAKKVEYL